MANQRISDTWLRLNNGKIYDKEIIKSDSEALAARLRNGRITFVFRPTLKTGERIKITLGRYPDMSLKDARTKVSEVRAIVEAGQDPRKILKDKIAQNVKERTVDEVFNYWFKHYAVNERSNTDTVRRNYDRYVGQDFGKYYYKDVTRQMMIAHFMEKKVSAPSMTTRVLGEFHQAINYCIDHDYIKHDDILNNVTKKTLGVKRGRTLRTLADPEIRVLFNLMEGQKVNRRNQIVTELLLLTGCRSGELRQTQLKWLDFNKKLWTIPWQYHKTGKYDKKALVRPILDEWMPLFTELAKMSGSKDYLLTNMRTMPGERNEIMTIGAMLHVSVSILRTANTNANKDNSSMPLMHYTNHDLRRTARTNWTNYGSWAVCEKMLGHALPGESDVYDKSDYVDLMRPVYRKWYNHIQELRGIKIEQNKIVSIR
jgi:integrase